MLYALDIGVVFKWEVADHTSPIANKLREDFRNSIHELIAPDILPMELAHALTKAERQRRAKDAIMLFNDAMEDCPRLYPHAALIDRAMEISTRLRIGVYDCVYIALAEREQCELITADQRMLKNVQKDYPFVTSLASLPTP